MIDEFINYTLKRCADFVENEENAKKFVNPIINTVAARFHHLIIYAHILSFLLLLNTILLLLLLLGPIRRR